MSKSGFMKRHFGRSKESTNLPAEYIQNHMEDEDLSPTVVSPPLQYVARINSFATSETREELENQEESLFASANEELQLLKEAVVEYQRKVEQKSGTDLSLITSTTIVANPWKDVKDAIQAAKTREDGQDTEAWSARNSCDKMANNISAFETWLDLLPSGDYGAVVSGVFKMAVTAAKRAQDVRGTILKALADIPYFVGRTNRYRDLYAESKPQELVQMTAQLCSAVLVALRHIMIYLREGVLKKALKAMAQGQAYKQALLGHIDRVEELIGKLDQEAAISSQYRLRDLEKLCQSLESKLTMLTEHQQQQNNGGFRIDDVTKRELASQIGEVMAGNLVNSFYSHLSSNPSMDGRIQGPPRLLEAVQHAEQDAPEVPKQSISETELLTALHSSINEPQQDLQRCLKMGTSLSLVSQDRVKWMMQTLNLQNWLHSSESCTLLINGNSDANETFSSTTFLSAKMLESLGNIKPIVSLHYFCSLHTSFREVIRDDATKLVRSFIVQLLQHDTLTWDLSFLSNQDLERIEANDLDTLCTLFGNLIQHLPSTTFLFWMIDGINYYERSEKRQGLMKVIHFLLDIIKDSDLALVKMLLTSNTKSVGVGELLGKDNVLTVPPTVEGSRQGWSERAFRKGIGGEIEGLGEMGRGRDG